MLLVGCGQPEVQPLTFNQVLWQDGEASLYRIIVDGDEYAGTVRYDITRDDAVDGTDGWTIRREVVARGDNEIAEVKTTGPYLKPFSADLSRTNSQGTETVSTRYRNGQVDMQLTTAGDVADPLQKDIPSDARDQRTILMMARLLPLASNYSVRFNSYLPVADLLDRVTLTVRKQEEVDVPAGSFNTWRVDLDTGDSEVTAWIGVDPPDPLVKYNDSRSRGTYELLEFLPKGE